MLVCLFKGRGGGWDFKSTLIYTYMLETNDILLLVGVNLVISGLFSVIFGLLVAYFRDNSVDRRITMLEKDLDSTVDALNNFKGQGVKAAGKEEQMAFMAQAAEILKGEGEMKDKIMKVIALNPQLALKMASKLGIGL